MIQLNSSGFNIVLFQPEIPANTGNIGRLCVGTNSKLHLIKPCRFLLDDKSLKRAGLDYWNDLQLVTWDGIEELLKSQFREKMYFCTTKTNISFLDKKYQAGDYFIFGPESRGLPEDILQNYADRCISIPMSPKVRSINLSNSVAIILYEAFRQINLFGIS